MCITEHHLKHPQIEYLSVENCNLGASFCRASSAMGGVCIYLHKSLEFDSVSINDLCRHKDIEACALKVEFVQQKYAF